jgi:hypothetical protein
VTVAASRDRSQIMVPAVRCARMSRQLMRMAAMAVVLLGFIGPVSAQEIPDLAVLPASAIASNPELVARRAALMQAREMLHGQVDSLNAQCRGVEVGSAAESSCENDKAALLSALNYHIQQSNDFNTAAQAVIVVLTPALPVPAAIVAPTSTPRVPTVVPDGVRIIKGINAFAPATAPQNSTQKATVVHYAQNAFGLQGVVFKGVVSIKTPDGQVFAGNRLAQAPPLEEGDIIETGKDGSAELSFDQNSSKELGYTGLIIGPNHVFELTRSKEFPVTDVMTKRG